MRSWIWGQKNDNQNATKITTTVNQEMPKMTESRVRALVEFEIDHPFNSKVEDILPRLHLNFTLPYPCDVADAEVHRIEVLGSREIIKNEPTS